MNTDHIPFDESIGKTASQELIQSCAKQLKHADDTCNSETFDNVEGTIGCKSTTKGINPKKHTADSLSNALENLQLINKMEETHYNSRICEEPENREETANDDSLTFVRDNSEVPIHRVMRLKHFYKLIGAYCKRKPLNTLARITEWEDMSEGFLYKMPFHYEENIISSLQRELLRIYGQCWSLNDESETCYMWNYYPEKDSVVQISSTIGQLWNSFCSEMEVGKLKRFRYIGKVKYAPLSFVRAYFDLNIKSFADNCIDGPSQKLAKSTFLKNSQYEFEREIRIIQSFEPGCGIEPTESNIFDTPINPNKLINRIVASPFMTDKQFERVRTRIQNSAFGDISKLVKSQLFK